MPNIVLPYPVAEHVEIEFHAPSIVLLNGKDRLMFPAPSNRYLQLPNTARVRISGSVLTLQNRKGDVVIEPVVGTMEKVTITPNPQVRETMRNVNKILVHVDRIEADGTPVNGSGTNTTTDTTTTTTSSTTTPQPPRNNDAALKAKVAELEKKLKAQEAQVRENAARLTQENTRLTQANQQLTQANARLTQENTAIQNALAQGMSAVLEQIRSGNIADTPVLRQKEKELEDALNEQEQLQDQYKRAQDALEAQKEKNEALKAQLVKLKAQEEVTTLDCQEATRELEALKTRLQMDGDILELTESRFLKNNSVNDTLRQLDKKITAAEDRIALILKLRERFDHTVQNAVLLNGDGGISLEEENGGPAPAAVPEEEDEAE